MEALTSEHNFLRHGFHDFLPLAAEENARSPGACLTVSFSALSISKLSQGEGTLPPRYDVQNTCFWRLSSLQEDVVSPSAPCSSMQRIRMQCPSMQVCSEIPLLTYLYIYIFIFLIKSSNLITNAKVRVS